MRGCGLSPFSDVLSAKVPAAARAKRCCGLAPERPAWGGRAQPAPFPARADPRKQGRRDAGGERRDHRPALLASRPAQAAGAPAGNARLQREPSAELVLSKNATSVHSPSSPRLRAKLGRAAPETPMPFAPGAAICTDLQLESQRQRAITRGKVVQAGFQARDPHVMGREGRETSQQSPTVSEWEGERKKPGNTWGVATGPGAQPRLGAAEGHSSYPKLGASRGKRGSLA